MDIIHLKTIGEMWTTEDYYEIRDIRNYYRNKYMSGNMNIKFQLDYLNDLLSRIEKDIPQEVINNYQYD